MSLVWPGVRTVADGVGRESVFLRRKLRDCCLAVHAVTSMDDAIDTMNR